MNIGLIGDRNPSRGSYSLPNFDINYGLGDFTQLKYELPLNLGEDRTLAGATVTGLGNSLFGVKHRFFQHLPKNKGPDAEPNLAFSIYPQLVANNPTPSVRLGVAELGPQLLLPMEFGARIGRIQLSGEAGYWFTKQNVASSRILGAIAGSEIGTRTEVCLEVYDQADTRSVGIAPRMRESTVEFGGRWKLVRDGTVSFMGMVGHSLTRVTPVNGQPNWIAYIGFKFLIRPSSQSPPPGPSSVRIK
jgi:hypothetical protein